LQAGQTVGIITPGGGGFGLEANRDPLAIAADIADGVTA